MFFGLYREQQANLAKEDLSDMVAEHAAKQKVGWLFSLNLKGTGFPDKLRLIFLLTYVDLREF